MDQSAKKRQSPRSALFRFQENFPETAIARCRQSGDPTSFFFTDHDSLNLQFEIIKRRPEIIQRNYFSRTKNFLFTITKFPRNNQDK